MSESSFNQALKPGCSTPLIVCCVQPSRKYHKHVETHELCVFNKVSLVFKILEIQPRSRGFEIVSESELQGHAPLFTPMHLAYPIKTSD